MKWAPTRPIPLLRPLEVVWRALSTVRLPPKSYDAFCPAFAFAQVSKVLIMKECPRTPEWSVQVTIFFFLCLQWRFFTEECGEALETIYSLFSWANWLNICHQRSANFSVPNIQNIQNSTKNFRDCCRATTYVFFLPPWFCQRFPAFWKQNLG